MGNCVFNRGKGITRNEFYKARKIQLQNKGNVIL